MTSLRTTSSRSLTAAVPSPNVGNHRAGPAEATVNSASLGVLSRARLGLGEPYLVPYRNPMAVGGDRPCWCTSSSLGNISATGTVLTTFSNSEPELGSGGQYQERNGGHELPAQVKKGPTDLSAPAPSSSWAWLPWTKYRWSRRVVDYVLVFPLICFVVWSMGYILFGDKALPGGSIWALAVLEVFAIVLGHVAGHLRLPPMLGMICAGLLLRNVPDINVGKNLDLSVTNPLRAMSVVVLLTRGAFAVTPSLILKHKWVIPQLYIGSCVFEAAAGTLSAYFILGFPLQWAAAVGCIFSAMSGAGVAPYFVRLEDQGLGAEHNVMRIAKEASGLDAILAINMTQIFGFGFIFADGDLTGGLMKGVVEVSMGAAFGLLWGGLAGILLDNKHGSPVRTFTVFAGGSMSLLGLTKIGYPRGGPLGVFFGSFVVACIWRQKGVDGPNNKIVCADFTKLWFIFQPLLFGIIGSRIDVTTVDWTIVSRAILCLTISASVRMCTTFSMLCFAKDMTIKEKLFIVVGWLPKGTVQAALGPVALETALGLGSGPEVQAMAYNILCISVTTIVLGSAFGPSMLLLLGSRLLNK